MNTFDFPLPSSLLTIEPPPWQLTLDDFPTVLSTGASDFLFSSQDKDKQESYDMNRKKFKDAAFGYHVALNFP